MGAVMEHDTIQFFCPEWYVGAGMSVFCALLMGDIPKIAIVQSAFGWRKDRFPPRPDRNPAFAGKEALLPVSRRGHFSSDGGRIRKGDREFHDNGNTLIFFIDYLNVPAVVRDNLAAQGQAQAHFPRF